MIQHLKSILCISAFALATMVSAQQIAVDGTTNTPFELINDVLVDSDCSAVSNVMVQQGAGADASFGRFDGTGTTFPYQDGIVLSSGRLSSVNQAPSNLSSDNIGTGGDLEVETELGLTDPTNDATWVSFDFVPTAAQISFNFIMASEEYDMGNFECTFSDAFAFLLTDDMGNVENLAVLPGTTTPILVTNIHPDNTANGASCPAANPQFFGNYNTGNDPIVYDGQTVSFTAQGAVTPGATYNIRLVVVDSRDNIYDTAVFLEAGSFNIGPDLGPDLTIQTGMPQCSNDLPTLDATTPGAQSYQWFLNGQPIAGETNPTLDVTVSGTYFVSVVYDATCTISEDIVITVIPAPTATVPADILACDITGTGTETFDLTSVGPTIFGTQSTSLYNLNYYETLMDAENGTNPISNPAAYVNTSNPQTIYGTVAINGFSSCNEVAAFNIEVVDAPQANAVSDFSLCDEPDNDGFTSFELNLFDAQVLNGQDASMVTVAYFASQADADANVNPLSTPFTNTVVDTQTIFVRITLNGNDACFNTTSFQITVDDPINVGLMADITACDDFPFDGFSAFNLEDADAQVLDGAAAADNTITYYLTEADALAGTNPIVSPYSNTTADMQTIYARIDENNSDCFNVAPVMLNIDVLPMIGTGADLTECDESPIDGLTEFDLSQNDDAILAGQDSTQFTVSYYASEADAGSASNPLMTTYDSTVANMQTVYARIDDNTSGCFNISSFTLITELCELTYPQAFSPNGDGINDTFLIEGLEQQYPNYELIVFNRAGLVIHEGRSGVPDWNGTGEFGKQQVESLLPVGTYFYVIKFNDGGITEDVADWVYMNY